MMNFKFHPNDVEIRVLLEGGKRVEKHFNSHDIAMMQWMNRETSEEEGDDIMVPIIEIECDDDDDCDVSNLENSGNVKPKKNFILRQTSNSIAKNENNHGNFSRTEVDLLEKEDLLNGILENSNAVDCKKEKVEGEEGKKDTNIQDGEKEGKEVFRCDLCGAGFRIKHSITKHKRVVHGMLQFSCMFCKKSYPLKRNLLDHILSHRGPHGFKCETCNKVRPNYLSIQRHMKTHGIKSIPCIKCGALFKTKWELKSHEIQHVQGRKFGCENCGMEFANPSKLREHSILFHSNSKRFKCEICEKEFSGRGNLTNHKKLHFEEKPFKCQYCSMSFFSNSARKKHVPIHEREKLKPYQCQDCNKKYTSTTSLAVHRVKFHSGGRIFHCHYCKEKFKSKGEMAEHVAEHAVERPHSCNLCLCRYKNKRELRRHQREKEHFDRSESEIAVGLVPLKTQNRIATMEMAEDEEGGMGDEEEEEDDDDDGWEMPEPEVCIKVADSDEGDIESILTY